jgi:hypothetical protein
MEKEKKDSSHAFRLADSLQQQSVALPLCGNEQWQF